MRLSLSRVDWHRLQPWIAALVGLVLLAPSVGLPWSLIDDPRVMQSSERLARAVGEGDMRHAADILLEPGQGRLRPEFWAARAVQMAAFGRDPLPHHATRIALYAAVLWLVAAIAREISPAGWAPLLSALFLAFYRSGTEGWGLGMDAWFRLGTQEPEVVLWSALSIYLVIRGVGRLRRGAQSPGWAAWVGIGLIPVAHLSKETTVVLAPLSLATAASLWIWSGSLRGNALPLLASYVAAHFLSLAVQGVLIFALPAEGYSDNYRLSVAEVARSAPAYLSFLSCYWLAVVVALTWVSSQVIAVAVWKQRGQVSSLAWQLSWLAWSVGWLAIQLPWSIPLPRYLPAAIFGLSLFLGLSLDEMRDRTGRWIRCHEGLFARRAVPAWRAMLGLAVAWLALFMVNGLIGHTNLQRWYAARDVANAEFVGLLARDAPAGARVYVNLPEQGRQMEWLFQMKLLLPWIYGRSDLAIVPLSEASRLETGSWVATWSFIQDLPQSELNGHMGANPVPLHVVERVTRVREWDPEATGRETVRRMLVGLWRLPRPLLGADREVRFAWELFEIRGTRGLDSERETR